MGPRKHNLFVYGTLRKGFGLHSVLRRLGARYLGKGSIRGSLYDLGEYPGAVTSSCLRKRIGGEIYHLSDPDRQLKKLDEVEEFRPEAPENSLFVRRRSTVRLANGKRLQAWVYFLPQRPPGARLIQDGNYAAIRASR
jgi:gamma-glutamylcyclotransferase (GGCT)/AIG2-like uncharacterized protein YtfP